MPGFRQFRFQPAVVQPAIVKSAFINTEFRSTQQRGIKSEGYRSEVPNSEESGGCACIPHAPRNRNPAAAASRMKRQSQGTEVLLATR